MRFRAQLFCWIFAALLSLTCGCGEKGETPSNTPEQKKSTAQIKMDEAWPQQMQDAIQKAGDKDTIAVVEIYDETCNFCLQMKDLTWKNKKVLTFLKDAVHCRLMKDNAASVIEKYSLVTSPTMLIFSSKGELLEPVIEGIRPPDIFVLELQNFLLRSQGKPEVEIPDDHPDYDFKDFGKG